MERAITNGTPSDKKGARAGCTKSQLTNRELEVLRLVAQGRSCKEVAVALGISVRTVEVHRSNIMRRINCHNIERMVLYAIRNRVIEA